MKLSVQGDRSLIRAAASSTRYVAVSFIAPEAPRRITRMPVNVALVLDRSGSMHGEKIVLARRAVEQALGQLHPEDRFAVVVYDDKVDVLVESTFATSEARRRALDLLSRVEPRGSTDLCSGWMRGCEQVALHADGASVSRCLLLTDGLANHGITDRDELINHAAALRHRGVQTSTFGVGADFDERLLQGMADAAGGHFYFIAAPAQIPDLLASELGEALEGVVRHAAIEVRLPSRVTAEPLNRFRFHRVRGENVVRVELGDLVSNQEVSLVVKLQFPTAEVGESVRVEFGLTDGDGVPCVPAEEVRWTWASHVQNDAQPRERTVDRQVASLYAARARAEATEQNRAGNYERARHVLTATALRIRSYAGNDPELNGVADALLSEVEHYAVRPLAPMELKASAFLAYAAERGRDQLGKSRRKPPSA